MSLTVCLGFFFIRVGGCHLVGLTQDFEIGAQSHLLVWIGEG